MSERREEADELIALIDSLIMLRIAQQQGPISFNKGFTANEQAKEYKAKMRELVLGLVLTNKGNE